MTRSKHVSVAGVLVGLLVVGGFSLGFAAGPPIDGDPTAPTPKAPAADDKYDLDKVPPVVVKTVPVAGSHDVDPKTKEIRVTFSKEMTDKSWSWATDNRYGIELPSAGEIAFDKDKKTCDMPVKLEPGKTYAVWINSESFQNFTDAGGRPAVPYLLVFTTAKK